MNYQVEFRKIHTDTIAGVKHAGTSSYDRRNVQVSTLPALIVELTEKGYELVRIRREGMV